jgi:hypothetical protein
MYWMRSELTAIGALLIFLSTIMGDSSPRHT